MVKVMVRLLAGGGCCVVAATGCCTVAAASARPCGGGGGALPETEQSARISFPLSRPYRTPARPQPARACRREGSSSSATSPRCTPLSWVRAVVGARLRCTSQGLGALGACLHAALCMQAPAAAARCKLQAAPGLPSSRPASLRSMQPLSLHICTVSAPSLARVQRTGRRGTCPVTTRRCAPCPTSRALC